MTNSDGEITGLLHRLSAGDESAFDRLFELAYDDLRQRAHRQLVGRRPGETLSTTALVNEAFLKLSSSSRLSLRDRSHFYAVAARAMRQIVVDHARRAAAAKRDAGDAGPMLQPFDAPAPQRAEELLELDEALTELTALDQRLGKVVELRFFTGLSVEETAEVLNSSPRTVKRDWQKARAFLYARLHEPDNGGASG